jgi:dTDP-4-dehydrorhamnose reductase
VKVLVIGRDGQLARSLAAAPKPDGLELAAIERPEIDLAKPETIAPVFDRIAPDLVINAAAYTAVDRAETEPELAHAVNAEGPGRVAAACARRGIPLIHISTDYVFDGTKPGPYFEDDAVAPLGVYGRSKLEGERRVAGECARHVILRTAWLVSPYGHNFVKSMLRLAASRTDIGVVDDQTGNPTYAPHLAEGILAIAQRYRVRGPNAVPWGVYHAAGSGEATWCDLAREVFQRSTDLGGVNAMVRPITTAEYPTPARRPANSRLDCCKLARAFDLRLPDWRVGVAECLRSLSDRAELGPRQETEVA